MVSIETGEGTRGILLAFLPALLDDVLLRAPQRKYAGAPKVLTERPARTAHRAYVPREASEAQQHGNRLGNFGSAERPAPRGLIIDLEKTARLRQADSPSAWMASRRCYAVMRGLKLSTVTARQLCIWSARFRFTVPNFSIAYAVR